VRIRPTTPDDTPAVERLVETTLGERRQRRLDEDIDILGGTVLVAVRAGEAVGIVAIAARSTTSTELTALGVDASARGLGIGLALVRAALDRAWCDGAEDVWLVTTNENLPALAVYQRAGFRLTALRPGAVDRARLAKPTIPLVGALGIPVHDELVLRLSRSAPA
jgi:ribosomal protein S18 acetylase RimI-like enzyme